jgi:hypothetical protein
MSFLPAIRLAALIRSVLVSSLVVLGPTPVGAAEQQAAQAPPGRSFSSDAGIIFNVIKPDKTADFEMIMGKLKEALQKSEDPARKQQAAGWKVFKSIEPGPNGNVLYLFVMDPAVKGADYSVSKILSEVFPSEVQDLYKTFSDAYAGGQNIINLQLVQGLGGNAGPDVAASKPAAQPPSREP